MREDLRQIAAPAAEPVSITTAKEQLRLTEDFTDDDARIKSLITDARIWAENASGRCFIDRALELRLWGFPGIGRVLLPRVPLKNTGALTHVKYLDGNGAQQTLTLGAGYVVSISVNGPPFVALPYGVSWPTVRLAIGTNGEWPVEVRFTAGYGTTAADVPKNFIEAMLLHIEAHYDRDPQGMDRNLQAAETKLRQERFQPIPNFSS